MPAAGCGERTALGRAPQSFGPRHVVAGSKRTGNTLHLHPKRAKVLSPGLSVPGKAWFGRKMDAKRLQQRADGFGAFFAQALRTDRVLRSTHFSALADLLGLGRFAVQLKARRGAALLLAQAQRKVMLRYLGKLCHLAARRRAHLEQQEREHALAERVFRMACVRASADRHRQHQLLVSKWEQRQQQQAGKVEAVTAPFLNKGGRVSKGKVRAAAKPGATAPPPAQCPAADSEGTSTRSDVACVAAATAAIPAAAPAAAAAAPDRSLALEGGCGSPPRPAALSRTRAPRSRRHLRVLSQSEEKCGDTM